MNSQQSEYIKSFLHKCNIVINKFSDLDGILISRDVLLDVKIYDSVKEDISILKQVFTSSSLTSLQSNAEENQKWPMLNLVRQILRSCHYKMTPKRVSAGYTKSGQKLYKRMFIIEKISQTELSAGSSSVSGAGAGAGADAGAGAGSGSGAGTGVGARSAIN
jgi:hypothetical protein